ncbi:MAG: flagellar motor switch protein FliM [Planctomycetaceae bacterium]|jgi:flagellar motor switch protein FliM|nr:flagellar motor switch protein FliM [Planctomycetaceae bacterium]
MAGDVLSQAEVENLLNMMTDVGPKPPAGGAGAAGIGAETAKPAISAGWVPKEKVTPVDFTSPDRVGKEQMKTLQTMHEGFGRKFAASLTALLRSQVEVKLTSVDQLAYSEFIFGLDNPTNFNLLRAEPLEGNLMLDVNPAILYPMIDRLLGGGREPSAATRRPLTEIEQRLVLRVTKMFLQELKHAWENVTELDFEVIQTESNPQLIQVVPPNEVVIVLIFEVAMVEVRGAITLCIPYNSFERISGKLTSNAWTGYSSKKQATPQTIKKISKSIRNMHVELKVKLAEAKMKLHEFWNLRVGDVICTGKKASSPLLVSIEGIPKYWAVPGKYKGYTAVQIEESIPDPTDLIAME